MDDANFVLNFWFPVSFLPLHLVDGWMEFVWLCIDNPFECNLMFFPAFVSRCKITAKHFVVRSENISVCYVFNPKRVFLPFTGFLHGWKDNTGLAEIAYIT